MRSAAPPPCAHSGRATDGRWRRARSKYKLMEAHMNRNKSNLLVKVPEIEKTLAAVKFLSERRVSRGAAPRARPRAAASPRRCRTRAARR